MTEKNEEHIELKTLADINAIIHTPARLMVMTYLYVVENIDYVYLKRVTGLTWGNLSKHLSKLEEAGYIATEKSFQDKKPNTVIWMTDQGREAFREYKDNLQQVLGNLPD